MRLVHVVSRTMGLLHSGFLCGISVIGITNAFPSFYILMTSIKCLLLSTTVIVITFGIISVVIILVIAVSKMSTDNEDRAP